MKHKKDMKNVKSVNKPSTVLFNETQKAAKDAKTSDDHQDIVKRLMTHSQYFPSNPNSKPVEVSYGAPTYLPYPMPQQYPTYIHPAPPVYGSSDFYYEGPQSNYNQYNTISPPLSSPSNNFDQISNGSPRNDYVFNGEFTLNFNTDFDGSFPLIDIAKTPQLFDNQAPLEMKPFDALSSHVGQLTPVTIESQQHYDGEIKNSFDDTKNSNVLVNLSDDDVLSNASYLSRSVTPSAMVDWKFTEHQ
jgi:hypothetical protein